MSPRICGTSSLSFTKLPSAGPRSSRRAGRLFAALLAALLCLPAEPVSATGGVDLDDFHSFFAPEIIDRPAERPFFLSFHIWYPPALHDSETKFDAIELANAKEWSAYLGGRVSDDSLGFLLYKMKLADLDKLIWALEGRRATLSKEASALRPQLEAVGDRKRVMQSLYYLGFAKRCEPITTRRLSDAAWDSEKMATLSSEDALVAGKLLSGGAAQLAGISDPFLQERYRFQRLRLMFYTGQHSEAEKYYAANIATFKTDSTIKYRFIDIAAGALRRNGKLDQANYLYSQVFGHSPPLKRSSYLSFNPKEDSDWKATLKLAKTDQDKLVLWQLLGIAADGLGALEKMFALVPGSDLLPLLLVREVNKAERDLAEYRTARQYENQPYRPDAEVVGKKRLAILKRIADTQKAYKPYLWYAAVAHLYALIGDSKSAATYLELAEKGGGGDAAVAEQLRMTRLLARLHGVKAVDPTLEPFLASELTWLAQSKNSRAADLNHYALDTLSKRYRAAKDDFRALLLRDRPDAELYRSNQRLAGLREFLSKPGKSPFDEFLARNHSQRYGQKQLLELEAINDLYAGRIRSAADRFQQAGGEAAGLQLEADPFSARLADCIDCDIADPKRVKYTRLSFVNRLLDLASQAEQPGAAGAQASLLMGNAFYNMSYYGNGRLIYHTAQYNFPNRSPLTVQTQLAEKYYKQAMTRSPDREVQAMACFMAAKTEQNRYFAEQERRGKPVSDPSVQTHSPIYFKRLQEQYANTRYYQEVVRECSYFRFYIKK